ncbi:MAG: reductive dehalogenase [Asgard group archaeon]|nr:reductive dehalogenase [Asgard group archaeon]
MTKNKLEKDKTKSSVSPNYAINDDFKPFSESNNIFGRLIWDKDFKFYKKYMYDKVPEILDDSQPGYTQIDHALAIASWTVHDYFKNAFLWEKLGSPVNVMEMANLEKYEINDHNIEKITKTIKAAAKSFGASLVGIAPYDNRWTYTEDRGELPIVMPKEVNSVIAIAIEMDANAISTTPSMAQGFANGLGYSKLAFLVSCLAEFIRKLGYIAIPSGNDTALSIPIAIDAGLGQIGRNGLLTTKEFGARIRLCKVFTNMPLLHDEPIDFGLTDYCKRCKKCAEACEVDAISFDEEPSFKTHSNCNNKGILRWAVNGEKCYQFWIDNGGECSTCITSCPFNLRSGKKYLDPQEYWERKLTNE